MAKAKKPYHHGDLRNSLLVAAERLLEQRGVGEVGLREVAKLAGVSHTAPYRHFSDKGDLLAGLATIGFGRLADATEKCVSDHPNSPRDQLTAASHAYVNLATRHSQMTNLMFGGVIKKEQCTDELIQISQRAFDGLLRIIENGQRAGLYIEEEPIHLALLVWSLAHGFSMLISAGQLGEIAEDENAIRDLVNRFDRMMVGGIAKK